MVNFFVEDLDSGIMERLQARAQQHGRSLQAEVKAILQQVIEKEPKSNLSTDAIIKQKSALMLQQIESHAQKMNKQIDTQKGLKELRKDISLGGLSIREAREEGRRY
jgi:plasmid stability protein